MDRKQESIKGLSMNKNPLYMQIVNSDYWLNYSSYDSPIFQKGVAKKYKAFLLIACAGEQGITENEILFNCRLSSGRNYPNLLEDELKIELVRYKDKNPDGIGSHFRYALANKEDAQKVINLILSYEHNLLSEWDINQILELYPDKVA